MQTFEPTKRKVAMISLPMKDRTREEIQMVWDRAKVKLEMKGYIVVKTLFLQSYADHNDPLWLLSLVLNKMSCCNTVYFCDGWEDARGCRIEHEVAEAYGLDIIYAEDLDIIYAEDEEESKAPITDEQKTFLEGMNHAEMVLDEYFDMALDAWSECSDEYQRSAKILKNGVIKWLTAAKFERYTDFVKENESKSNE